MRLGKGRPTPKRPLVVYRYRLERGAGGTWHRFLYDEDLPRKLRDLHRRRNKNRRAKASRKLNRHR